MQRRRSADVLFHLCDTINQVAQEYESWRRRIQTAMPDGYPSGGDIDHISGGGIGDPTVGSMLGRRRGNQLLDDADKTIAKMHELSAHLRNLLNSGPQHVDISAVKRASRCSGSVDPTCTNVADGRRHKTGLCDRCWMAQYRAEKRAS